MSILTPPMNSWFDNSWNKWYKRIRKDVVHLFVSQKTELKQSHYAYYVIAPLLLLILLFCMVLTIIAGIHESDMEIAEMTDIPTIDTSQMVSCFSSPILSSTNNSTATVKLIKLNTYQDYLKYCRDYNDIEILLPQRDDRETKSIMYQNGYIGVVVTSKYADPQKLLYASYIHFDDNSGRLYIALTQESIPNNWILSKDLENSKQATTIAFISKEKAEDINSVAAFLL